MIGDVGQNTTEEIDVGDLAGKNMGWLTVKASVTRPTRCSRTLRRIRPAGPARLALRGPGWLWCRTGSGPDGLTGRYLYVTSCNAGLRTLNSAVAGGDPVDPGITPSDGAYSLRLFGEDSRGAPMW